MARDPEPFVLQRFLKTAGGLYVVGWTIGWL